MILALLAGALMPLAFAPYGYYFFAPVCLAILFYLWDGQTRRVSMAAGGVFGLGMFGFGVSWVQISVHQFGLPVYAFSIAVTAAFVVFLSAYLMLCAYLISLFPFRYRYLRLLILFPAAWTVIELLRGWLFTGFPWLLVGYSQVDSPLAAYAPILGVYGVSFIVALVAALFVVLVRGASFWRGLAFTVALVVAVVTVAINDISWTTALGGSEKVALVQGAVPQGFKWRRDYRQPSVDLYENLSEAHWGNSLIIWPETAIPAFAAEVPESIARLDRRAKESGTALLLGLPTGDSFGDGEYYNSVIQLGVTTGRYDKRHLVPFGEYLPFDSWLRPLTTFLDIPMSNFSAGKIEQSVLQVDNYTVGVSICYEDAYAGEVARAMPSANVLVNVSNDAWFGDSIAPHQHLQIARMRALENERYLLRATNTGISAIINQSGEIEAISSQFVSNVVTGTITPLMGATPFVRFGSIPIFLLCMILIACTFWLTIRGVQRERR